MVEGWRRFVALPLGGHLAAIAVVLLALVPVLDDGLFSADEAAALAQLDLVEATGEWTAPNPDPELDPGAEALPMELAHRTADGRWAPFAKHALWVDLLRASRSLLGDPGPRLLSVVSTVAAALAAALLARRLVPASPGAAVATAWLAGVGSPLLLDGYLVIAHTLGAACAGFAALAALDAADPDRTAMARFGAVAVAGVLAAATGLVRSEGALLAVALGGALVVASAQGWRRPVGLGTVLGGGLALVGPLVHVLGDRIDLARWGEGIGQLNAGVRIRPGGLEGRFQGFVITWLNPAYAGTSRIALLTIVGVTLLWLAAYVVRRRLDSNLALVAAVAGAGLVAIRLVVPPRSVPGLLAALPALVGLVGLDRETLGARAGRLLFTGWWLFALAVLATQYADGGGGEWGGRYFAIGLPLVLPLAVAGLGRLRSGAVDVRASRGVVGAVAVATVALSIVAVLALRSAQHSSIDFVAQLERARDDVGSPGEPAVVLTTRGTVGRFLWDPLRPGGIHTVSFATLDRYAERLAARGEPVVFYGDDVDEEVPVLEGHFEVERISENRPLYRLDPR